MLESSDSLTINSYRAASIALVEEGFERSAPDPNQPLDQLCAVTHMNKHLGGQLTDQYRRETKDPWAVVKRAQSERVTHPLVPDQGTRDIAQPC